ncbi:GDSL-type esterase/lipase family protein [Algivirga pacifica]|uniref:SGNH/GDSL hydrolase family protein n=1 Tax=Algivirga pacifica TaxID=1162670 RepID=A0ABP9D7L0_9BACT
MKLLLLGDSITEAFDTDKLLPHWEVNNQGVWGDSTYECLSHITEEWFSGQPYDYVFICIGTNDLVRDRSDKMILDKVREIIQALYQYVSPKESKVVLTTLFPTLNIADRTNERIDGYNQKLAQLAAEIGVDFYHLNSFFKSEDNALKEEFSADGLHLTETAYKHWSECLQNFIAELTTT